MPIVGKSLPKREEKVRIKKEENAMETFTKIFTHKTIGNKKQNNQNTIIENKETKPQTKEIIKEEKSTNTKTQSKKNVKTSQKSVATKSTKTDKNKKD